MRCSGLSQALVTVPGRLNTVFLQTEGEVLFLHNSFSDVLADCSTYEQRVLLDIVTAAKKALRSNRAFLITRRR